MIKRGMITLRWLKPAHDRKKGQIEKWSYSSQPEPVHEWVSAGECEVVEWKDNQPGIVAKPVETAPKDRMVYRRPAKKIAPRGSKTKAPSKE